MVWPHDEGKVDEASVRANYQVIKHLPEPYGMWNDILLVTWGQWVMKSVAECWKVWFILGFENNFGKQF